MGKYKVFFNGCYGGFGVSERGAEWLLANGANPDKVTVRNDTEGLYGFAYVYVGLERHDPLLVRMVETLKQAADGLHARLYVHQLDQPLYRINEYDGSETVEEPSHVHWDNASTQESA
jgi:hypothetical protein